MIGHIDTTVVAAVFARCHSSHKTTLQRKRTSLVAVFAQIGSVAQRHRKGSIISSSHKGCLISQWDDYCSAKPNFHTAVRAIHSSCSVDGHMAQIIADDIRRNIILKDEPRVATYQINTANTLKRGGTYDVIINTVDIDRLRDAIVILLGHTILIGEYCRLSNLTR